jgi:ubiquinone/menaquinone biosynthesis C-methylase UbiE
MEKDSFVIDVGCGNGKNMLVNKNINIMGCDVSESFVQICNNERNLNTFVCDNLKIPLRSNIFDYAISIAVIHHFTTRERRKKAIKEILRILKVGGKLMIYVWAFEQKLKVFFFLIKREKIVSKIKIILWIGI